MAVRLAVIMIESAPPTAAAGRFAADVVGNLIGRPGLDLTLVSSLSAAEMSETDRLTLEAVSGDLAVLDWQSPESMLATLATIGVPGCRWPHRHDPHAAPQPAANRRIYAFEISRFRESIDLVNALEKLNQDRQTQTFAIGNLEQAAKPAHLSIAASSSPQKPQDASLRHGTVTAKQKKATTNRPLPSIDLDDLIDQLDQSDQS